MLSDMSTYLYTSTHQKVSWVQAMTCPTIICQTVARGSADTTVATTACWSSAAALLLLFALGVISPSLLAFANYTAAAHAAVIIPAMGSWPRLGHVVAHLMSCCTSSLSPTLLPLIWSASLVICRASECTCAQLA